MADKSKDHKDEKSDMFASFVSNVRLSTSNLDDEAPNETDETKSGKIHKKPVTPMNESLVEKNDMFASFRSNNEDEADLDDEAPYETDEIITDKIHKVPVTPMKGNLVEESNMFASSVLSNNERPLRILSPNSIKDSQLSQNKAEPVTAMNDEARRDKVFPQSKSIHPIVVEHISKEHVDGKRFEKPEEVGKRKNVQCKEADKCGQKKTKINGDKWTVEESHLLQGCTCGYVHLGNGHEQNRKR